MKKLSLDLNSLVVDSFDTSAAVPQKGTVFGEQCTCHTACTCPGCPSCDSCDQTLCDQNTCWESCNDSCDISCDQTCLASCQGPTCDGSYTCNATAYYKYCCA